MKQYQVVVLGATGAGKSSLCRQMFERYFEEEYYPTTNPETFRTHLREGTDFCSLEVTDMGGKKKYTFRDTTRTGFVFVYDVTSPSSFQETLNIIERIRKQRERGLPLLLVANKIDQVAERKISTEQGREAARSLGAEYLETSALNRESVDQCFFSSVNVLRQSYGLPYMKKNVHCS